MPASDDWASWPTARLVQVVCGVVVGLVAGPFVLAYAIVGAMGPQDDNLSYVGAWIIGLLAGFPLGGITGGVVVGLATRARYAQPGKDRSGPR